MMWSPIIVTPPVMVAGIGGVFSRRWAKTYLPITAAIYTANGLLGEYYHARGVARRPGGFSQPTYNLAMGPPIMAPGLMTDRGGDGTAGCRPAPGGLAVPEPAKRDLRKPDHLPNLRAGKQPRHPSWLPRQRQGTSPQMIGRYPDYDVLENAENWDAATREVVTGRLDMNGPLRFFTAEEEPALRALCDVTTAQDAEPRVPVAEMVDDKYASGRLDGYRYANMPARHRDLAFGPARAG